MRPDSVAKVRGSVHTAMRVLSHTCNGPPQSTDVCIPGELYGITENNVFQYCVEGLQVAALALQQSTSKAVETLPAIKEGAVPRRRSGSVRPRLLRTLHKSLTSLPIPRLRVCLPVCTLNDETRDEDFQEAVIPRAADLLKASPGLTSPHIGRPLALHSREDMAKNIVT